jgi:hypothetical protein
MIVSTPLSDRKDSVAASPLSKVLDDLRHNLPPARTLTMGSLVEALRERGIGALMVLFALLVMIPIPGLNTIFAAPLVLLTARQALGRNTIWLPNRILERSLDPAETAGAITKVLPWLRVLEKILRPRMPWVTASGTARLVGAVGLSISLFASIPVPLTHTVPGAGLLLMAGGIMQRDGLAILAGIMIGMTYIILLVGAIALFGPHAVDMIHNMIHHAGQTGKMRP